MPKNTNPWEYWLEDFPRALYGASIPGGTKPFSDYWRGQYGNVYGDYQTELGKQALAGQPPNLGFGEFLGAYPFSQQYGLMSPRQRGHRGTQRLSWRV